MDRKFCPLKSKGVSPMNGEVEFGLCEEYDCAWFDKHYKDCAINTIGGIVFNLIKD